MGKFSDGLQRILQRDDISIKTSGAETVSTTGSSQEIGDARAMTLTLDITAVSGTSPTMVVDIEGSDDGVNFHVLARIGTDGYRIGSIGTAPANFTGADTERFTILAARFIRYKSTIGGTNPSFTYSIGGTKA